MPDRYGENPEPAADSEPNPIRIDRRIDAEMRERAIADCHLCDHDGYRGSTVCDHEDHQAAARRGMDMIREAMGWPQE